MKPAFIFMQIDPQFQKVWPMGLGLLGPQKNSLLSLKGHFGAKGVPSTNPDPKPEMAAGPDAQLRLGQPQLEQMNAAPEGSPPVPGSRSCTVPQESPQPLPSKSPALGGEESRTSNKRTTVRRSMCTKTGMRENPKMGPFGDT